MRMALRACIVVVLAALVGASAADAQPLRRTLSSYFLLAQRKASVKNLSLDSPCNVGVNCASPGKNSSCGVMALGAVTFVEGSQAASDLMFFRKPGAVAAQVFRNGGGALDNVTLPAPPQPFTPPIIPGTCDAQCQPNTAALETACGFPDPFPDCDAAKPVLAQPGADCAPDATPGNGACDLPPGTYGYIVVQNAAKLNLTSGTYVSCGVRIGRNVVVTAHDSTVLVSGGGFFKANNGATVAEACGDLRVLLKGKGSVSFGRHASIAADICAPASSLKLGHANQLTGHFVGDTVSADSNNHGRCCGGACACFNDVTPRLAHVGDAITLVAGCDLSNVSAVRVCGQPATIVGQTTSELMFTVPTGASGACRVEIDSASGTFEGSILLSIN
ncbi:MAG TPA: hypothetical protein VMS22_00340 [Candidatus Eisenbacteria bacterium]|nr:hypothetical protein [Candidatus Eisenbacteria bacterium]